MLAMPSGPGHDEVSAAPSSADAVVASVKGVFARAEVVREEHESAPAGDNEGANAPHPEEDVAVPSGESETNRDEGSVLAAPSEAAHPLTTSSNDASTANSGSAPTASSSFAPTASSSFAPTASSVDTPIKSSGDAPTSSSSAPTTSSSAPTTSSSAPTTSSSTPTISSSAPTANSSTPTANSSAPTAAAPSKPEEEGSAELGGDAAVEKEAEGGDATDAALLAEQLRFCANIVRGLKRHRDAGPFLHPVDPVALNIPDYLSVITRPMDIGTVTRKLEAHEYATPEAFIEDVQLIFSNCFTYNHTDSQVSAMGRNVEKYFSAQIAKLPTALSVGAAATPSGGSGSGLNQRSPLGGAAATPSTRPRREQHHLGTPARSSATATPLGGTPATGMARRSVGGGGDDLAICHAMYRELTKKSNQAVAWPFLTPVDPIALGIPDYYTVIKEPMDLSTIKRKLDAHEYSTPADFEADFRLILNNCYTYNAPGTDVVNLAHALERLFDAKWAALRGELGGGAASGRSGATPHHHATPASSRAASGSASHGRASAASGAAQYGGRGAAALIPGFSELATDSDKILAINKYIQLLQGELNALLLKRKGGKAAGTPTQAAGGAAAAVGGGAAAARTPKSARPSKAQSAAAREEEFMSRPMTFEEKRDLSLAVNNLAPEKLGMVVDILRAYMPPQESNQSDVIELDIESLNVRTLRELQKFVQGTTQVAGSSAKRRKSVAGGATPSRGGARAAAPSASKKAKHAAAAVDSASRAAGAAAFAPFPNESSSEEDSASD